MNDTAPRDGSRGSVIHESVAVGVVLANVLVRVVAHVVLGVPGHARVRLGVGIALLLLAHTAKLNPNFTWLTGLPITDIGSALFTTGLLAVAFEYIDRRDGDERANERLRHVLREEAPASHSQHPGSDRSLTVDEGYKMTPRAQKQLASLSSGLKATIAAIHHDAPRAQIVLINYYQILPKASTPLTGSSPLCRDLRFSRTGGKFRTDIRAQADFAQSQLNSIIAAAALSNPDVLLVNISNLFTSHEFCTADKWMFDETWSAAHPNIIGQRKIAARIIEECERLPNKCVGR